MLSAPPQIADLLESLGLATPAQMRRAGRHVRRLARHMPPFESVWLDALAQCGVLTWWQAGEFGAGRGLQLRQGPYVLAEPLADCLYAQAYRARHIEANEQVRLIVAEQSGRAARETAGRLRELVEAAGRLTTEYCVLPIAAGQVGQDSTALAPAPGRPGGSRLAGALRLWIAAPWIPGRSAADWLICHGRMPATAVLQIARAMAMGLAALEGAGLCHGDIAVSSLWLADDGRVMLTLPGVRGVLRPEEGYSRADLLPEAFDYLAPERVARGTAPNILSDLYACGCVWWHLLCGRAPLGGGDSLAKLRAAHEARIPDLRELAPDTPAVLAEAIVACTQPAPEDRPRTAAELAAMLPPPSSEGRRLLGRSLRTAEQPRVGWPAARAPIAQRGRPRVAQTAAMAFALGAALLIAAWPVCRAVWEKTADDHAGQEVADRAESTTKSAKSGRAGQEPSIAGEAPSDDVLPVTYLAESKPEERHGNQEGDLSDIMPEGPHDQVVVAMPDFPDRELLLDPGKVYEWERLNLRPGQRVGGRNGTRVQVHVPAAGLNIAVEGAGREPEQPVQFESIDFTWAHAGSGGAAMAIVEAENVTFRNCTFQGRAADTGPPIAVRWVHPPPSRARTMALPSGSIRFADCQFRAVAAGLDCRSQGVVRVEFVNVLHLGPGSLVQSAQWPRSDESMNLVLEQVTLRGAASLWRCRVEPSATLGRVLIRAERSVFAPVEGGSLVLFHGDGDPAPRLQNLSWEGEGALVTPGTHVAARARPGSMAEHLDDTAVPIAGLVLSTVEFAGPAAGVAANSGLLRWNAPLRTADPPGCNPARLP